MDNYKVITEYISKLRLGDIKAANSINKLIEKDNFENNLKVLDKMFFKNKLQMIGPDNYQDVISTINSIHKIKSGKYNDFNIWSASRSHLKKNNEDLLKRHDELNDLVGFPDNGNGLYKSFLGEKNFINFLSNKFKESSIRKNKKFQTSKPMSSIKSEFKEGCKGAGLTYSDKLITRFIASLVTKPFVILTGLSGSGKTKLSQAFAQWVCQDESQYSIIPVGADWTNREPLLGYPNALNPEEYVLPDNNALDLIVQAKNHPELPYFLILDEMNLSHVERYFADFLSVMESKEGILLYDEGSERIGAPAVLEIPSNLFIIGTVNIDETTNMFSPKVLDRANTIEFRVTAKEMKGFLNNIKKVDMKALDTKGAGMAKSFLNLAANKSFVTKDIDNINKTLLQFFSELKKTGAEFGYRSATEILRLIGQLSIIDDTFSTNEKIDIAIMQKLLPKLHGSRRKLCPVLITLGSFCIEGNVKIEKDVFEKEDFNLEDDKVLYPLSLEKIKRMYKGAIDNGFTSFAEA
ncbi:McrB family protein [Maribacter sp. MAR_2009_72]|uniref:McrB family protein n=1 Tax=Maribacter sp. MAR_2009_72 TaxID=1250050 RepID=UPI00119BDB39|nr:hypothetical protein [Maribacter sp. MAR_2009_72]TVZ16094.1 hypothetical protein JM81_2347 [Maribacter sp. MAR_2009_72]